MDATVASQSTSYLSTAPLIMDSVYIGVAALARSPTYFGLIMLILNFCTSGSSPTLQGHGKARLPFLVLDSMFPGVALVPKIMTWLGLSIFVVNSSHLDPSILSRYLC